MNRLLSCIVVSGLAAALCFAPPSPAEDDIEEISEAISRELGAVLSPEPNAGHDVHVAFAAHLYEIYSSRQSRPIWINEEAQQQLLTALAESADEGLDPEDYLLSLLREMSTRNARQEASADSKARYDILLTEAALRLGYHLAFGKVDPETFDPQWNYARTLPENNLAATIEEAASQATVNRRLAQLKPTHALYEGLKRELARYRAIERAGGWAPIASGPTIKPGQQDQRVPALRARLSATDRLVVDATDDEHLYDEALQAAVKRYQSSVGLAADAVVGPGTLAELNVSVADRITQLRVNLDRGRVLLHDLPDRFVVVNIAAQNLYVVRDGGIVWSSRVQVGKSYRKTPIFRSEISYIVFNPTWTVPPGIIAADILPAAQQDPRSITRRGLRVLDSSGREVDPASVDWTRFRSGHIPYTLRQDPGPANALGRVKLMFANPYLVYLHDTPSQSLFERSERAFSSGCVRVEHALQLAEWVLDDSAQWNQQMIARTVESGQLRNVTLKSKVPVLLTYWTAWANPEGSVEFRRDLYGRDALWTRALNAPMQLRKRPLFAHSRAPTAAAPRQ